MTQVLFAIPYAKQGVKVSQSKNELSIKNLLLSISLPQ
jgi:hypothetical protein